MVDSLVAIFPDAFGGGWAEQAIRDAKVAIEFEMAPVVEGIAEEVGHGGGEFFEFFPIRSVSGAVSLMDAVGTHGSPFVMISIEPNLGDILPSDVLGDLLG